MADHRFNELEQSQNFSSLREPRFLMFIPLAKGLCCGRVSLRTTLLTIVSLDLMLSVAWVVIGLDRFFRSELSSIYAIQSGINAICLILSIICIVAIVKRNT